ncbi:chorismate--pyruvate lyase family protein [Bacterioplanoides sp.]|uniref:chorismate--pyruvate lyase family protein n=1 Tax=Bacterioplanoides sp. TaxID=2066072 RepID=UPI003B5A8D3A
MNSNTLNSILHPLVPDWSTRNHMAACCLPAFWRDWLLDTGSLTARLCRLGNFRVEILREFQGTPTQLERQRLALSHQARVWVREVVLKVDDVALVYARTAIPQQTLQGKEKRLQHLGEKSLGSYLFQQPNLQRQPLAVSHCNPNQLGLEWCRHSVFTLGHKPLMVSEAFTAQLHDFV